MSKVITTAELAQAQAETNSLLAQLVGAVLGAPKASPAPAPAAASVPTSPASSATTPGGWIAAAKAAQAQTTAAKASNGGAGNGAVTTKPARTWIRGSHGVSKSGYAGITYTVPMVNGGTFTMFVPSDLRLLIRRESD